LHKKKEKVCDPGGSLSKSAAHQSGAHYQTYLKTSCAVMTIVSTASFRIGQNFNRALLPIGDPIKNPPHYFSSDPQIASGKFGRDVRIQTASAKL
jgi:hypothetical protein